MVAVCSFAARKQAFNLLPFMSQQEHRHDSSARRLFTVSLYRLFLAYSDLHIIRAPEPFLRLPYESVSCPGVVGETGVQEDSMGVEGEGVIILYNTLRLSAILQS